MKMSSVDLSSFVGDLGQKIVQVGLRVLFILVLMGILGFIFKFFIRQLEKYWKTHRTKIEDQKRAETLAHILWIFAKVILAIIGLMLIMDEMGVNIGPLLAAAGFGGLALGFGAQTLVKDLLSGFFLLLENQIRVGDVVEIAGVGGIVEKITLRTVTLRDLAGNVHIVPHSSIDKVTNKTKEFSYYVFDIGVSYHSDTDQVVNILKEVSDELQEDPEYRDFILAPLEILGLDRFADSAIIIKTRIKTEPIKQWFIGREMNRRIKIAFNAKGIEIPFPQRTISYAHSNEKG